MKQVLSLLLVAILLQTQALTQDTLPRKKRIFKVSVYTVSGHNITGYMPAITDTALFVSHTEQRLLPYPPKDPEFTSIPYSNLEMVRVRRKGATGRSILIGALIGFATGAAIGLADGDDENRGFCIFCLTAGEKALVFGAGGGLLGGITGAIIGATAHKKFIIGGSKPAFDKMRLSVLEKINRVSLE